jgi:ABC-type branched-subunit amino acid transport system ATPase component
MAVLEVDQVSVRYGGVRAVEAASLTVDRGAIVGLIGPNGAGKTSLLDAITGFTECSGSVTLTGRNLNGLAPHKRCRAGLARTFQQRELFSDLNVLENVEVVMRRRAHQAVGRRSRSSAILEHLDLSEDATRSPDELPNGRRALVDIARALATEPLVMVLDEPAAGLDSAESQLLADRLRRLCSDGLAMLLIDHDMDLIMSVSDYVYVLDFGRLIAAGKPEEVVTSAEVVRAYIGNETSCSGEVVP